MLIDSRSRVAFRAHRRNEFRRIFQERLRELMFKPLLETVEPAQAPKEPAEPAAAASRSSFAVDHSDSLAWLAFRACLRPARESEPGVSLVPSPQQAEEVIGVWTRPKSVKAARPPRTIDCESAREG
jgi:hypothetical protein